MEINGIGCSSFHGISWNFSIEFHWNWCPYPPWNAMEIFSTEIDGIPWRYFLRYVPGAPNDNFRKNICSEDDLISRIFGTFFVKFLACLMTRFIRLWNSPQRGSFNFRCPCKNLIRIQLIATNLSWLVYFASLMEDEQRRKTDTICIIMRSRANFKAGMKVARSSLLIM